MTFNPGCTATAIGSFPHQEPAAACALILDTIPEIPVWPQLPNIDFRELMDFQYCEGLPCVVLNETKKTIHFNTSGDFSGDFEKFYEGFLAENLDCFKISPEFSRGIYRMEELLQAMDRSSVKYIKSQVTGPVTFGLSVMDESKKAVYYNEVFRDVIVKGITMKARWLLSRFAPLGCDQICFVDEPVLSAFGSSTYVSVQRPDVISCMKEVIETLHKEGALIGTHCCGNTDWTILVDAGVDIINFDAYEYGQTIAYYPDSIRAFLDNGGVLAWGIVPTSDKIQQETPESLVKKLQEVVENLSQKGLNKSLLWDRCLLTPSCGTGSMSIELAEKVMHDLAEVSRIIRGQGT
jgi:methionine synthase II (cobalamin-independent)